MDQYLIYLEVPAFVKQWLLHSFGEPSADNKSFIVCKFPDRSVENATILTFSIPTPVNVIPKSPDRNAPNIVAVVIPQSKYKKPCTYNYLTTHAKKAVVETIENNFKRNMYSELNDLTQTDCKVMTAICAWCDNHGIDIEHADTIRQRYYRIRDAYKKKGIDLMKHRKDFD